MVDSYATGIDIEVSLPETHIWPEMGDRTRLTAEFCYSGAFYCIVDAEELGFHGLKSADLGALSHAAGKLKSLLNGKPRYRGLFHRPDKSELRTLYGVIVRGSNKGFVPEGVDGAELGVCFFGSGQQVDLSPCGSGSAARRALAHAKHR